MRSFRGAVEYLKLHEPEVYGKLNESTVRGWFQFGSYKDLTPNTMFSLKRGSCFYKPQGSGRQRFLDNFPNIKGEILDVLKSLCQSGNYRYVPFFVSNLT